MTEFTQTQLYMSANGLKRAIGPDDPELREQYEQIIRNDYERCHPDETFDDLKYRARFSKEDQGLLRDWMAVAAQKAKQRSAMSTR